MKKNMIALAVAGALVAPVAMAEVTISGGLQAELVQIGGNSDAANGLYAADGWQSEGTNPGNDPATRADGESGGNYGFLKFSASEDLGGGMKALAVYNLNANVGDNNNDNSPAGAGGSGTREAYVGLSGGFGTVLAGSLTTPYAQNRGIDPFIATSFQARGNGGMNKTLHNGYVSNAVAYANSFMGGMIKLTAAVALDESAKTTGDSTVGKHAKTFAVDLAPMSGLTVTVAYIDMSKFGDTAGINAGDKRTATKVAAKYGTGAFSVAAQLEMLDKGFDTETGAAADKHNVMFLTGTFNIDDANSVSASYGSTDKKAYDEAVDKSETYMAIGFKHAFSKSTSAMVGYRQTKNIDGVDGDDEKAAGVGMRVAF